MHIIRGIKCSGWIGIVSAIDKIEFRTNVVERDAGSESIGPKKSLRIKAAGGELQIRANFGSACFVKNPKEKRAVRVKALHGPQADIVNVAGIKFQFELTPIVFLTGIVEPKLDAVITFVS